MMATCKECLHFEACSTIYEKAFREKPEKYTFLSACPLFKDKANYANYAEVKRGRWIWTETGEEDYEQYWVCSVCGGKSYIEYSYCPNCGAKMDLE